MERRGQCRSSATHPAKPMDWGREGSPDTWGRLKSFWGIRQGPKRRLTSKRTRGFAEGSQKVCAQCLQPYGGFGSVCSACRKGPKRGTVKLCRRCHQFFSGFAARCADCEAACEVEGGSDITETEDEDGSDAGAPEADAGLSTDEAAIKAKQNTLPLLLAVCSCDASRLVELMQQGESVNQSNHEQVTPLLCAVTMGNCEVAEMLIANGANVNAADTYGAVALHSAAFDGSVDMVKVLLRGGAEVRACDDEGYTALHLAAGNATGSSHDEVARLLLDAGADPLAVASDGFTPLAMAAMLPPESAPLLSSLRAASERRRRGSQQARASTTPLLP